MESREDIDEEEDLFLSTDSSSRGLGVAHEVTTQQPEPILGENENQNPLTDFDTSAEDTEEQPHNSEESNPEDQPLNQTPEEDEPPSFQLRRSTRSRPAREIWSEPPYSPPDYCIKYNFVHNTDSTPSITIVTASLAQVLTSAAQVLDPLFFQDAMKGPDRDTWLAAAKEEYQALMDNKTWKL